MDERLKFIGRLLAGEKMAPLCREFGISRVTGYKILNRYKACGLDGLHDRSRAPYRQANQLPYQVEPVLHWQSSIGAKPLPISCRIKSSQCPPRLSEVVAMVALPQNPVIHIE